jgi:D-galacturonate reductase
MVEGRYKPVKVTASATTGIATSMGCDPKTEDTITLLVDWQNLTDPNQRGTAVYTASWAAPLKAGVHSEQRFHYMAAKGEVRVDQAHRGYSVVEDDVGKLDVSLLWPMSRIQLTSSTTLSTLNTRQTKTDSSTERKGMDTSRSRSSSMPHDRSRRERGQQRITRVKDYLRLRQRF